MKSARRRHQKEPDTLHADGAARRDVVATASKRLMVLLGCGAVLWACGASNPSVRVRRLENGRLAVEGPMAGPFQTLEALAAEACGVLTSQPGAANGQHGFEYCGLYYRAEGEEGYYLSYLSDIGGNRGGGEKYCQVPTVLEDASHPKTVILGVTHSHPHNRRFSPVDVSPRAHWLPTRLYEKETQRVLDRHLLMFFREQSGECRSYAYNNSTRVISALREGKWVPIGEARGDAGSIQMYEGKGWLP